MRSDYHGKHKSKDNKKALDTLLHRWSKMSKFDKVINSFLGLAIIVLILSLGILIHSNSSPQYTKKSNNREMVSSTSSKSSKKQDHQVDEEINDDSSSASSTNEVEEAGSAISNKNTDRKNHGEVSEGMNAEYRMAKQAGIIDDRESVQDFYNNVQDNIDDGGQGSFTYNGKTVYVEKTYQGNPNGIESGGTIYGDPDRYTVTTDQ